MSKQLNVLDNAQTDINNLLNSRLSENYMQRAYAQSMMNGFADSLKSANQQNAAMAAVGGGMSAEQLASQKAANANAMGSAASAISQAAEASRQGYDQMKVNATQNITAQKVQTLDNEAARRNAVLTSAITGAAKIGGAFAEGGSKSIWGS